MTFWFFACLQLLDTVQKLKEINSVNENGAKRYVDLHLLRKVSIFEANPGCGF